MNIADQFRVPVSADEAWRVLLDIERIAPCLPGAQLQEVEGDDYRGVVKVKVGPISAQYTGAARIVEADEQARRIVLQADGRDTRGQGTASATLTVTLAPDGDGTVVGIDTDLNVTGRVAQLGRGVMADVSSKLLKQFAESLETDVLSGGSPVAPPADAPTTAGAPTAAGGSASEPEAGTVRVIESQDAAPIDLMATAGGALAKRVVPVLVVVALAVAVWLVTK
jgi:carbon monoxide dehydrogenase subunit G